MSTETRDVFEGKSFAGLLKDIYDNSAKKKKQIEILVNELRPLIKTVNEAAVIVPLIKDYLEVGVRNDELLVKMSSVFQKYMASDDRVKSLNQLAGGGGILTDQEKDDLLRDVANELMKAEDLTPEVNNAIDKKFGELLEKVDTTLQSLPTTGDK